MKGPGVVALATVLRMQAIWMSMRENSKSRVLSLLNNPEWRPAETCVLPSMPHAIRALSHVEFDIWRSTLHAHLRARTASSALPSAVPVLAR
jgi:hypothetical protein